MYLDKEHLMFQGGGLHGSLASSPFSYELGYELFSLGFFNSTFFFLNIIYTTDSRGAIEWTLVSMQFKLQALLG